MVKIAKRHSRNPERNAEWSIFSSSRITQICSDVSLFYEISNVLHYGFIMH